jgi:polyketide synthase PksJ
MVLSKNDSQNCDTCIATLNKMGYMVSQPDICMQKFVDFCKSAKHPVLDIGAAYGVATYSALETGAQVVAVDLDQRHLDILKQKTPPSLLKNLSTIRGGIPEPIDFEHNTFDAILISRVLHFLSPDQIMRSIAQIENWLRPGGRVFISVATPFAQLYEEFIPIFLERKKKNIIWPGIIENVQELKHSRMGNFPNYLNLFDKEILEYAFSKSKLSIKECFYLPSTDIPEDMRLDGKEGMCLIAEKEEF